MKKQERILYILMLLTPFCIGGYLVWCSALVACILLALLGSGGREEGEGQSAGWTIAAFLSLPAMLLAAGIWGIDRGQAWFGFVKFLPLPLFGLVLRRLSSDGRERLWNALPVGGLIMTAVSLVLWSIPATREQVQVNGRLAGFFQYPNTYAVYLLCGILVLVEKVFDRKRNARQTARPLVVPERNAAGRKEAAGCLLLIVGMLLSGSRTALVLAVAATIVLLWRKKRVWLVFPVLAGGIILFVFFLVVTGNLSMLGRFFILPTRSSTFLGRLLYAADALPVIACHPLGLGYSGYYYLQGSFQTGVYATRHVHNELLQLLLDVGWLPAGLFLVALWKSFRALSYYKRLLMAVLLIHSLFDFDFQFVSMGFVLVLLMTEGERADGRKKCYRKAFVVRRSVGDFARRSACIGVTLLCLWVGTADLLAYIKRPEWVVRVCPLHTESWMQLLAEANTPGEMEAIARQILRNNQSISLAYDALANVAYAQGDAEQMIVCKKQAIALARYEMSKYEDYLERLFIFYEMYLNAGMTESAEYCRERILEIPVMLQQVKESSSPLAWRIYDKPQLDLTEKMWWRIEWLQGASF